MFTFDIDTERLLTMLMAVIGILAVLAILLIGFITKRHGSILSYSQSKSSRVISFVLGMMFIFLTIYVKSYEFLLVSIALILYSFGSSTFLAKLQNQPPENQNQRRINQKISELVDLNSSHSIIQKDEIPGQIRKLLRSLLRYLSWIGITALIIYGLFLLYIYKPIPESISTPLLVIGIILGSILGGFATLYSIFQLINRIGK